MFRTLRSRLLIGIAPLLAVMVGLGLWAVVMFTWLGGNIDVILRENYRSVLAAENLKESLERMDSAALFAIGGQEGRAKTQFAESNAEFAKNLKIEQGNITLPGEQKLANDLDSLFLEYLALTNTFFTMPATDVSSRTEFYFQKLLPMFDRIKQRADDVLRVNQRNMEEMDVRARSAAKSSVRWMILALIGSAIVAASIAFLLSRSILEPIQAVTFAARAMAGGNLEQVVPVLSRNELGELGAAFNSMARTIREFQQAGTARLLRAQKTAQATIDSFPDPVVLVDTAGLVERANPAARRLLNVIPVDGEARAWHPPELLQAPLSGVLLGDPDSLPTSFEHAICLRDDGQERYFLPRVLAIREQPGTLLGAAIVLSDITRFRMLDQLKSDMVSTVSHELKTPLTSIQMAVHLLLEEVVGPLNPKQVELMLAARQDSDRLLAMVNDLLDLTRIEHGRVQLNLEAVSPSTLAAEAVERFEARAIDVGVELTAKVDLGLPPVQVDRERIVHVFDNLIGNALAHTDRAGSVRIEAHHRDGMVQFLVRDTGEGIPPEHLPRIFERFFRVPGSRAWQGAGLGLAITREIVVSHGGQIDATSVVGSGTTFQFTLPVATPSAAPSDLARKNL